MFDWKNASLEECAWQVARTNAQRTTGAIAYYKRIDNQEVLTKILEARKIAKRYRVLVRAEQITEEILKEGLDSANYTPITFESLDK